MRSREFYVETLGLEVDREVYRPERGSHKLDLRLPDGTQVELFSLPGPPRRPSHPEACGLGHLAFEVADVDEAVGASTARGVPVEPVRVDELTAKAVHALRRHGRATAGVVREVTGRSLHRGRSELRLLERPAWRPWTERTV